MALDFEALTPSWLTPEAQGFIDAYGKTLEEAGALTPADWPSFLSMALSWGTMMASAELLAKEGVYAPGSGSDRESVKKHPAVQIYRDAEQPALRPSRSRQIAELMPDGP